jgi:multidrug efflux system outer membrane protein
VKHLFLLSSLLIAGCAVGPDFQKPQANLPASYLGSASDEVGTVAQERWWQDYEDPVLNEFIERGLNQNLDVMAAIERISEARANLRGTGVNAALDGDFTGSRLRSGEEGSGSSTSSSAELDGSFVIDLFGGLRRERENAAANLLAAEADVETVRLAWLAELISAYSDARYYQAALQLSRETVTSREETVKITSQRFELGDATEYELAEAEALLDIARADLPQYQALFNANVFAISSLLNEPSGPILDTMETQAPQLTTPAGASTGLPVELLRNRPDVRSAEARLMAAVANVGVAEADLYPSLSLTGTTARISGTNSWSFGPELTLPVFDQGALRASRDAKLSLARQAEIDWRVEVVDAVEEVQIAASNLEQYRLRAAALNKAAKSYEKALALAHKNYRAGAITLLDLLDTDRLTEAARVSAASAVNDSAQAWATLQLSIGAGAALVTE